MSAPTLRERIEDAVRPIIERAGTVTRTEDTVAFNVADAVLAEIAKDGERVRGLIAEATEYLAGIDRAYNGTKERHSWQDYRVVSGLKRELERVYGLTPEEGGR